MAYVKGTICLSDTMVHRCITIFLFVFLKRVFFYLELIQISRSLISHQDSRSDKDISSE